MIVFSCKITSHKASARKKYPHKHCDGHGVTTLPWVRNLQAIAQKHKVTEKIDLRASVPQREKYHLLPFVVYCPGNKNCVGRWSSESEF